MDPTPPSPPPQPPSPSPLPTGTSEAPPPPHLQMQTQNPSQNPHDVTYFTPKPNLDENPQHRQTNNQAMANFRAFVMKIAASNPKRPLAAAQKRLIENRLNEFFPHCHTPDHPTYAAMINRAIVELNEEGGSSEESISKFIKNEYDDLPLAHSTFLKLHLQKLCESGEIVVTRERCFLLGDAITELKPDQSTGASSKREKLKDREIPCNKDVIKEENQRKEEETERTEMEVQATDLQNKMIGEQNQLTKDQEAFEEHNQPAGENDEVILEQDKTEEEQNEAKKEQGKAILLNDAIGKGGSDEKTRPQKVRTGVREEQKQPGEEQNDVNEGQALSRAQQIEVIGGINESLEQQSGVITERDQQKKQEIKSAEKHTQLAEQQSRVVEGLSWSQSHKQQQQEQEKPQHRKLVIFFRHPKPEPQTVANVAESLPLEHCHEEQQEPADTVLEIAAIVKNLTSPSQQCQNEQQKPVKQRRGRPPKPKPKPVETSEVLNSSYEQQLPVKRRRGRPPMSKSSAGQSVQRRRGRPPKLRPEIDETTGLLLNSSFQHNPQPWMQQEENLVQEMTPKWKSSDGRNVEIRNSGNNQSVQDAECHERWTQ